MRPHKFFTSWTDLFHFFLGFFIICINRIVIPLLSLVIMLVFIVYETRQEEDIVVTTIDFVEYILGFLFCIVVAHVIR